MPIMAPSIVWTTVHTFTEFIASCTALIAHLARHSSHIVELIVTTALIHMAMGIIQIESFLTLGTIVEICTINASIGAIIAFVENIKPEFVCWT